MRLVSALYRDFYPFHNIDKFVDFETVQSADEIRENDCLIVWGGSDIHPSIYGKAKSKHTYAGDEMSRRDVSEWTMMLRCRELGNPIIGVCRGAQMLCALAGGTLIQHVNNHGGRHEIVTFDGQAFKVNSIHHQMMNPINTEHNIVAWTKQRLSDVYFDVDNTIQVDREPEFIHFPTVKGFAIQWHPEGMEEHHPSQAYINAFIASHL